MLEHAATFTAALVGLTALYVVLGGTRNLGPDDDYWERIRARFIPVLDRLLSRVGGYAETQSLPEEYAGTLPMDPEAAEVVLYEKGFHRNPMASLKTLADDRTYAASVGSWALRESRYKWLPNVLALRQTHVTLYRQPGPTGPHTALYAHEEYNSLNPFVTWHHYRGKGGDVDAGVETVREVLAEDLRDEPPGHLEGDTGD